jgi:cytochrome c551/c552
MAGVRREILDHPQAQAEIEDECTVCHMPMARTLAVAAGGRGEMFRLLPTTKGATEQHRLAADGVSCTLCHQIAPDKLGTPESFVGGYVVAPGPPRMQGPFEVDKGLTRIMQSATGVEPAEGKHIAQSELCATCHTLVTQALAPDGSHVGSLPEQVPYQEWLHSAFREERSCQSCHMPAVAATPIASVLGEPRDALARHTFLGGNFFMLRMLNRFRDQLGVEALAPELDAAAHATIRQLQTDTASVAITRAVRAGSALEVDVAIRNLTGHKLPTGYPSRRVWLHVSVKDAANRVVFESGSIDSRGAIGGNDNDADAQRYEPHYEEITRADQVQIYESTMADSAGRLTTGLLQAVVFVKDNRLLPQGFDKRTAGTEIAVRGAAVADADFTGAGDAVRYRIPIDRTGSAFMVEVALRYQPIAFRWADNLRRYDAPEPRRFIQYWDQMSSGASIALATTSTRIP